MKIKKSIQLDINKEFKDILFSKKDDVLSRYLDITLYDNGNIIDLTGNSVKVYAKKPDGTIVFNNVTILDTVNGKIEIELTSQMLQIPGVVKLELAIIGVDNSILTSRVFLLNVAEVLRNDDAIESQNEFTALVQGLSNLAEYDNYKNAVSSHTSQLSDICVDVKYFGAKGDGVTDDTAAIQLVLDTYKKAYFPPGTYVLNSPLRVAGGMELRGPTGLCIPDATTGAVLKPATTAVTVKDINILNQDQNIIIENLMFNGGTSNTIDLPLMHFVKVKNCVFRDILGFAIVICRGERIAIEDIFIENLYATQNTAGCISFCDIRDSIHYATLQTYNFGTPGQWIDRVSLKRINAISISGAYNILKGIWANNKLQNCTAENIVLMGLRGIPFYVGNSLELSHISTITLDNIGTSSTPVDYAFYVKNILYSTIENVCPANAGNVYATKQFSFNNAFGSSIISCYARGDNVNNYGFYVEDSSGRHVNLIGCVGTYYDASNNVLKRAQPTIISCKWELTNCYGSTIMVRNQQPMIFNYMQDDTGALACNVDFRIRRSTGSGGYKDVFGINNDNIKLLDVQVFSGTGSPEGVVAAQQGSIYLRTDGGVGTTFYVKESGSASVNTGWKPYGSVNTIDGGEF